MGGKQSTPKAIQQYVPQDTQRYKRVCLVCHRTTYDWKCCGNATRRIKLETTIGERVGGMK